MTGERTGLPMTARQEQFSLAFVHLVVSAAGCWIKNHSTDYDGVDITIASSEEYATHYGPQFELQVKCTTQHERRSEQHMSWAMKARPFEKLTNPKRYVPAVLGVLLVPVDGDWLDQDEERLLTRSRMYFARAADLGEIPPGRQSTTVRLPRSNLFDVAAVRAIMADIGNGGDW